MATAALGNPKDHRCPARRGRARDNASTAASSAPAEISLFLISVTSCPYWARAAT